MLRNSNSNSNNNNVTYQKFNASTEFMNVASIGTVSGNSITLKEEFLQVMKRVCCQNSSVKFTFEVQPACDSKIVP